METKESNFVKYSAMSFIQKYVTLCDLRLQESVLNMLESDRNWR